MTNPDLPAGDDDEAVLALIQSGELSGDELGRVLDERADAAQRFAAAFPDPEPEQVVEVRINKPPTHVSEERRRNPDGHFVIPPPGQGDG